VKPTLVAAAAGLLLAVSASTARGDDSPNQARDALVRDQKNLMTVLGAFALGSMATGVPLLTSNRAEVRAVGVQNLVWGAVDGALALVALSSASSLQREDASLSHWVDERASVRRVFAINAGLDVLYLTAGALLVALGKTDTLRGTGGGILAQGGFLFAFDSAAFFVMAPRR